MTRSLEEIRDDYREAGHVQMALLGDEVIELRDREIEDADDYVQFLKDDADLTRRIEDALAAIQLKEEIGAAIKLMDDGLMPWDAPDEWEWDDTRPYRETVSTEEIEHFVRLTGERVA